MLSTILHGAGRRVLPLSLLSLLLLLVACDLSEELAAPPIGSESGTDVPTVPTDVPFTTPTAPPDPAPVDPSAPSLRDFSVLRSTFTSYLDHLDRRLDVLDDPEALRAATSEFVWRHLDDEAARAAAFEALAASASGGPTGDDRPAPSIATVARQVADPRLRAVALEVDRSLADASSLADFRAALTARQQSLRDELFGAGPTGTPELGTSLVYLIALEEFARAIDEDSLWTSGRLGRANFSLAK